VVVSGVVITGVIMSILDTTILNVVFGLSETETHGGMGDPIAWGPIVAGLVLVAAFVMHAARAPRPLIDVKLFKVPAFGAASATTFLLAGSLFGARWAAAASRSSPS
jgi:hypothetical protein